MKTLLPALLLFITTPLFAKTLTIGVDVSGSNPLVQSDTAAKAAAAFAQREIAALQLGDRVTLRRFGARHIGNMPSERLQITRKTRAPEIARAVLQYIAALPKNPQGDNETNILAFLEFGTFDCANGGRIVLFTDGIEASKTIGERAFLSGKALPPPSHAYLKSCEIVMFGLGQSTDGGLPPELIRSMRGRWAEYFKAAGASFTAIIDP